MGIGHLGSTRAAEGTVRTALGTSLLKEARPLFIFDYFTLRHDLNREDKNKTAASFDTAE